MPDFSLSISFSTSVVVVAALLAAALSFFVYRVTIPAVHNRIRFLLIALRTLSLFFLFLLIAEPILSLLKRTVEPPQTLVLVDNSRSMTITDQAGARSEELRSVLDSEAIRRLSEIGDVQFALFDSRIRFLTTAFSYDSLSLTGDGTNLSQALKQVKEQARTRNIRALVILSDGNSTSGSSPIFDADDLQLPIFTVGIGDTTERRDVLLQNVQTNTLTYAGTRVPVNITIRSTGYDGQRVEVVLRDSANVLDRQFLTLQNGDREYTVTLHVVPEKPGIQKYRVAVSNLPEELTDQNNRATFFTKVLKSKMRVFILAGSPSTDLSFIRRVLERDPNVEVTVGIERSDGTLPSGILTAQSLRQQDCLLLMGIPREETSSSTLTIVADAVANGMPLLFISSRQLDPARLGPLEEVLPVVIRKNPAQEVQMFLQVPDMQKRSVFFRIRGSDDLWGSLPPLFQVQHAIRIKPEAQILAFSRINAVTTTTPVLAYRSAGGNRSLAVTAYGLWRWKMMGDTNQKDLLDIFLENSIRWLTSRDEDKKIRVRPALDFFSSRDPVEFVGQVYDDASQPMDDAGITVTVENNGMKSELALTSLGNGQYAGELENLPEGDYSFSAEIQRGGAILGRERGSFSVGALAVEFLETRAHPMLLRQLAARTGGEYFSPQRRNQLPGVIQSIPGFRSREVVRAADFEIWNAQWSMILLLVFFAAEWIVRKRHAMV